jgi:integrase
MVNALRRVGYTKDEIVAHSFRGIFSTIAHEHGYYSHDVIETQLAHTVGSKVSQAYNRAIHLKERTEMMEWYSRHLEYIMSDDVQK